MPRRGENIHKRKDGRWEARYRKGLGPDGKTVYGSVYGSTYREAKEKLLSVAVDVKENPRTKADKRTFGDALNLWLEHNRVRCKGSTMRKYEFLIETHILPKLGAVKLRDLSATMINRFLTEKLTGGRLKGDGGLAPSYVRTITQVITGAVKYAVSEEMCPPLKTTVFRPQEAKRDLTILGADDLLRLEDALITRRDRTAIGILLSLYTGLRIGEVCALRWEDIELDIHVLHVRRTVSRVSDRSGAGGSVLTIDAPKTKASVRDIPISSFLSGILRPARPDDPKCYVASGKAKFLSPRTFEYRYHSLLRECGVKRINYHALRHTFATRCIEAGIDVKSLSEILGHSDVRITLGTYVHSSMELKRTQMEKLKSLTSRLP